MVSLYDRVLGMLLGVAIGDAKGLPREGWSRKAILAKDPEGVPANYEPCARANGLTGTTSDDWQLTHAVAEGIIRAKGQLDINWHVLTHVEAFNKSVAGWGGSTRESVRRLSEGIPHTLSAISSANRGKGNGCSMKVAPIAAHVVSMVKHRPDLQEGEAHRDFMERVYVFTMRLALMTHNSVMAVQSAIVQQVAATYCLAPFCDWGDGEQFDEDQFIHLLTGAAQYAEQLTLTSQHEQVVDTKTDFAERMKRLYNFTEYDIDRLVSDFGALSCYIGDSLPPVYILFLQNHSNVQVLDTIINAGGDTDTTASMLGALLGALNGPGVFPEHLVEGLQVKTEVFATAKALCKALGIEKA